MPTSFWCRPIGTIISAIPLPASRMGTVRDTRLRTGFSPDIAHSYTSVARVVREMGLLQRTRLFYGALALG